MSFYDAIRVGASGAADFEVERSLRFNRGDSTYIQRTSSTGNQRTWTVSFWMKFCEVTGSTNQRLWTCDGNSGSFDMLKIEFDSGADTNRRLSVIDNNHASSGVRFVGERSFRDPSAWYHIVVAFDTTQATAANRVKIYVNNEQTTVFKSGSEHNHPPDQNYQTSVNASGKTNTWGRAFSFGSSTPDYFDGYLAEINFIDGLQLTPSSFAETNSKTGQWVPIDTSGLTFGTNGYRLKFSDNSGTTATTLGKDSSGNGNNLTPNNFSVAAGAGNDSLEDTPTNNFCTLNPITFGSGGGEPSATLSNGNLDFTESSSNNRTAVSTFGLKTGKWYFEFLSTNTGTFSIGWHDFENNQGSFYRNNGSYSSSFGGGGTSGYASWTTNDIVGVAIDFDSGKIWYAKNNTWQSGDPATGNSPTNTFTTGRTLHTEAFTDNSSGTKSGSFNYGQRPFTYTPPTGYKSMCSANLPDPTILLPNKHFDTLLYTGNGATSSRAITGLNFSPNWVWLKNRESTYHHQLHDTNRGTTGTSSSGGVLYSNNTQVEDNTYSLASFDSNGFSISKDNNQQGQNNNGDDYVAWNWNAGDTDSATYRVVVVSDSGNKYRFRNSANTATFAQSAVTLDLAEGGTYTFDQSDSTMSSHPMKLSTTANGTHGGGSSYNTGVTYELDGSTVTESAFVSGFSSATSRKLIITVAASAPTLYYYCHYHSGMGGQANTNSTTGSSNFDGTIQSTVRTNASAGFSIITYTGTGADGTIGHGLGVIPDFAITKKRSGSQNWSVKHSAVSGKVGYLDLADQFDNSGSGGGIVSDFSSSLNYSITRYNNSGNYGNVNESSATYVAYVFSEVAGYSKFGSYVGNGNSNGPFIYTGFKPAFIFTKAYDSSSYWYELADNKRVEFNPRDKTLYANVNDTEYSGSSYDKDFLSNGFKPRSGNNGHNGSSLNYIYMAFAESPFKNNRAG